MNYKRCSFCENFFPNNDEYFYYEEGRLKLWCKSCCNKRARENYRKRLSVDPEYREKLCEISSKYYKKNKDKVDVRIGKYKKTEKYREIASVCANRRKSFSKNLISTFTALDWKMCKQSFGGKCAYCGEEEFLTQDHFVAVSNGGEYAKGNIIPACTSCNCSKQDKQFADWYPKQSFYSEERRDNILSFLGYNKYGVQLMAFF